MTQTIQSGVGAKRLRGALGAGMVVLLVAVGVRGHAETVHQSGSVSGPAHGVPRTGGHAPGYLGIGFQDLGEEQAAALHLKLGNGVEVTKVDQDGPAGRAGLRPHDVIVSLNGQMLSGADGLHKMIREAGVGMNVALVVLRGGQSVAVNAQLASRDEVERQAMARMAAAADPTVPGEGGSVVVETYAEETSHAATADTHGPGFIASMLHMTPFTGLAMETMEPQLAAFFGVPAGTGLLVHTVMPNSPAAVAGLRAGDVVVKADAVAMKSAGDWTKRLHASKGAPIALTVIRDKRELTLMIVPDLKKHAELVWPRLF